jgi:hypothetical protein
MINANWIAGLLALVVFANAQYQGWSLFEHAASTQASRVAGSGGRTFHK